MTLHQPSSGVSGRIQGRRDSVAGEFRVKNEKNVSAGAIRNGGDASESRSERRKSLSHDRNGQGWSSTQGRFLPPSMGIGSTTDNLMSAALTSIPVMLSERLTAPGENGRVDG